MSVTRAKSDIRAKEYLQGALAADEFLLHAQKVVSLEQTAAALGYELLPRVRLQGGRILTLSEFVSGGRVHLLLPSLDRWVVSHFAQMMQGRGQALSRLGLAISLTVTSQSAQDSDFAHFLSEEMRRTGVAQQVLVDIPEAAAVASINSGDHLLRSFCSSGCRLSIDGVGPDLKPLAALKHLPIGLVKIDGRLVRAVLTDSKAEAAVRSIVEFARKAGITTVAKCVETIAVAEHLRKLGVWFVQGYAFGHPEPFACVLASL